MKVAILAPIGSSLYSRLVLHLALQEPGIEVCAVIVRSTLSLKRFASEFRRDGTRLLDKVLQKVILQKDSPSSGSQLAAMAEGSGLKDASLREMCRKHPIPFLVAPDHNSARARSLLAHAQPDVIAFTGGGLIRKEALAIPRLGVLNCHSGILPGYRGMDVVEWPLAEGKPDQVGLTLHFMDAGVDTGPILLQKQVQPETGETFTQLRARMEPMMVELMIAGMRGLRDGTLAAKPQSAAAGRQYFVMHPRIKQFSQKQLLKIVK